MQLVDSIKWHLSNHKIIVCAFYTRGAVYENEIYPFVEKLEKHREELSPIYYEDDNGNVLILFYRKNLKKLKKCFRKDKAALQKIKEIFSDKLHTCWACGCDILSTMPYSYRDIDEGVILKRPECSLCNGITDESILKVSDFYMEAGSEKTVLSIVGELSKTASIECESN